MMRDQVTPLGGPARTHGAATVEHPAQLCVDHMQFSKSDNLARTADEESGRAPSATSQHSLAPRVQCPSPKLWVIESLTGGLQ
jgi:hypothetical protein